MENKILDTIQVTQALFYTATEWDKLPEWLRDEYEKGNVLFLNKTIEIKTKAYNFTAKEEDWLVFNGEVITLGKSCCPEHAPDFVKTVEDNFETAEIKIELAKRITTRMWHAQISGNPKVWGTGESVNEAIGSLVRNHWKEFNLGIKFVDELR